MTEGRSVELKATQVRWWVGLLTLSLIILPFVAQAFLKMGLAWPCMFKVFTGLPCATCGGTRALAALSRFEMGEALKMNPLVVLVLAGGIILPFLKQTRMTKAHWIALWSAIGLNWIYLMIFLPR